MGKKQKTQPKFTATLPRFITGEFNYKRVSRELWDTLPVEERDSYFATHLTWTRTIYRRKTPVPVYLNPKVDALRKKLTRQRVKYVEHITHDREFITITTIF